MCRRNTGTIFGGEEYINSFSDVRFGEISFQVGQAFPRNAEKIAGRNAEEIFLNF